MIFTSTVRRLTVLYTLIQLAVFATLAIGVYLFVTVTFDFDTVSADGAAAVGAAEQGFQLLRIALVAGFGVLCVVAPFTSFWMARVALEPLKQSYESQQHFVDDASHEFRGPLSVIRGELELAVSRPRSQSEYRKAIATSLEATQTLIQLTDDLLILARDSNETLTSRFGSVSCESVIREALGALPADARTRITTRNGAPIALQGVTSLLVRALANILDNAIKFSPDDSTVTLSVQEGRDEVTFSVTDRGAGMTANEVRHAFDRFWRAPSSSAVAGHGLGLALVQRVAHLHDGRASMTSSPGSGTTVTLTIPLISTRRTSISSGRRPGRP